MLEGKWGIIPDMSGVRSLAELVGIETAKRLTMTAEMFSGTPGARDGSGRSPRRPPRGRSPRARRASLTRRSPDQLAAAKRLFNDAWTSSPRRTFARERVEQAFLLFNRNTRVAREAAFTKAAPVFGPRSR